ncbi:MAG: chemotaxis response regulator protein-glutamate methylesterase [Hyphomicrobiales bacterium]|nr:MAG: chemotaxis response regulator protein-glutamate methylesterase [Hyphomicrobiales bacterium]
MVVDDSVVVRGLLSRWIDENAEMAVVASHRNGRAAVEDVERANPDVVVLDVEMPEMDGLTALPLLLKKKRDLVVIMASTLTRRNAEVSLKALSLGAQDYVPKPESNSGITTSTDFRRDLLEKIRQLGGRRRRMHRGAPAGAGHAAQPAAAPTSRFARPGGAAPAAAHAAAAAPAVARSGGFATRPYSSVKPRILVVGSSTGGPQALTKLFGVIGRAIGDIPVLVTQHMPPTFTAILAEHLMKAAGRPAAEGKDGESVIAGRIYVAPGGKHMLLAKGDHGNIIRLNDGPAVNFCKPAVDPMFESVSRAYGSAVLSVVLTGMGSDGAKGAGVISSGGGSVIAQDEASSVVWGMPGATANSGVCSDVLPLDDIGPKIMRVLQGGR